jgi:membrane fusion protein (multidrug efflux system)
VILQRNGALSFQHTGRLSWLILLTALTGVQLSGCGGEEPTPANSTQVDVTVMTVAARDVPAVFEYVAQAESSRQVNIQARVSGFLDSHEYVEGTIVKEGQVLFLMDKKPFQAQVDAAKAQLSKAQATLAVATANIARVKPLAKADALSQKDLDNAEGQFNSASASVDAAKAQLETAQLNLSYCTITSPVTGISGAAAQADGSYLDQSNSQLTTVALLSPMWVNFSLSENELQKYRDQVKKGHLTDTSARDFTVEVVLADGQPFPYTGRITFANPSYNTQTGTFLIRATVDNPEGLLLPNQYVRARVHGITRPNAILVPQRAVMQGSRGHFVWLVDKDNKARQRPVTVGNWVGNDWLITEGLHDGDLVVVDGGIKISDGVLVNPKPAPVPAAASSSPAAPAAAVR